MEKNSTIMISQVENGFIVEEHRYNNDVVSGQPLVFRSMEELKNHISEHFDHREEHIECDNKKINM